MSGMEVPTAGVQREHTLEGVYSWPARIRGSIGEEDRLVGGHFETVGETRLTLFFLSLSAYFFD